MVDVHAEGATLAVQPAQTVAHAYGETFSVDLVANNLVSTQSPVGIQFALEYNASVLEFVQYTNGTFLNGFANTGEAPINSERHDFADDPSIPQGYSKILFMALILPDTNGNWHAPFPNGNGTLSTVTFRVLTTSSVSSPLLLKETRLLDANLAEISHSVKDGLFVFGTATQQPPNKDGTGEPFSLGGWLPYLVIAVVLIIAVAGAFAFRRRRRKRVVSALLFALLLTSATGEALLFGAAKASTGELVADINLDGVVNFSDVLVAIGAFGSYGQDYLQTGVTAHPRWNSAADITGATAGVPDNKVDIIDIAAIAKDFGKMRTTGLLFLDADDSPDPFDPTVGVVTFSGVLSVPKEYGSSGGSFSIKLGVKVSNATGTLIYETTSPAEEVLSGSYQIEPDQSVTKVMHVSWDGKQVDFGKDGEYNYELWSEISNNAGDVVLRTTSGVLSLTVDAPPRIRFTYPGDKSLVPGISVLIMGEVDEHPASMTVNGVNATVSANGYFWARLMIEPGPNSVVASAGDLKGRASNASMTVFSLIDIEDLNLPLNASTDGSPPASPVLDILESPVDFPIIKVGGKVGWGSFIVTVVGGVDVVSSVVDVYSQRFEVDVTLNLGENALSVTAVDVEGLESQPVTAQVTYNPRTYFDPKPVNSSSWRPASWPPSSTASKLLKVGSVFGNYLYSIVPTQWPSSQINLSQPVLRIIDVSQSWNFTVLSETPLNDTYGNPPATYIALRKPFVEANRLYISKDVDYPGSGYTRTAIEVYDVSDPTSPKALFKGFLPTSRTGSWPVGIEVANKILYVPHRDNTGIDIVNFTDPASPKILSSKTFGSYMTHAVKVVGSIAYVTTYYSFITINVTNPANPVQLGSAALPDTTVYTYLEVDGNFAYLLGGSNVRMLRIFDVSDPTTPMQAAVVGPTVNMPSETLFFGMYPTAVNAGVKKGNTVYLTGLFKRDIGPVGATAYPVVATVVALDVSNPFSPNVTGYVAIPSAIDPQKVDEGVDISVTEDGAFAYVTGVEGLYRLTIRDGGISFPDSTFVPKTFTEQPSISMASTGDLLVVVEQDSEVLDEWFTTNEYVDRVRVFDISDPQVPVQLSSIKPFQGLESYSQDRQPARIKAVGDLVYIFSRLWSRNNPGYYRGWYLTILSISDPSNPVIVSDTSFGSMGYNTPRDPYHTYDVGVDIVNNVAFIPLANGIGLVDVSNSSAPRILSTFSTATSKAGFDVKVFGNTAMLLTQDRAVMIDISNRTNPTEMGSWAYPYVTLQKKRLEISGNTAYLGMLRTWVDSEYAKRVMGSYSYYGNYNSTLWVLNITDPSAPSLLATMGQPQFVDFQIREIEEGDFKIFLAMPAPNKDWPEEGEIGQPYFGILSVTDAWEFPVYKTFSDVSLISTYDNYYSKPTDSGILITEDGSTAYVASGPPIIKTVALMHTQIKIEAITPSSGHAGTIVTITGRTFSPKLSDNTVTFGDASTIVLRADARSIDVAVPYIHSGNYTVRVTVQGTPSQEGVNFELTPVFLNETDYGQIAQSTFASIGNALTEIAINFNSTDPTMYQYVLDLRNFIELVAQNVSRFDNETKLFFDATFASMNLSALFDDLAQQIRTMRGTQFSDYCDTAERLKISEQLQKLVEYIETIKGAAETVIAIIGAFSGPGDVVVVLAAEATIEGLIAALRITWGVVNTSLAGQIPIFLSKITIQPSDDPIVLYLPDDPPDQPSKILLHVTSTWTNDPQVVGFPLTDFIGGIDPLNDLLVTLGLPTIPDIPVWKFTPYEVNVPVEPGEDFTLETYTSSVVEVNTPSAGYVSAVEDGIGAIKAIVKLYGAPVSALSKEVAASYVGDQYIKPISVRVKEPGPTIKIISPEGRVWQPGEEITTWVEATDGATGGNERLSWIEYSVAGAASAKEVKTFTPPVDETTINFSPVRMPDKVADPNEAWILITATAHDDLGRKATAQKIMKMPFAQLLVIIPPYEDFLGRSYPEGERDGPFRMMFYVAQSTTAGTSIDSSTIKIDFGNVPFPMLSDYSFWDRINKFKQGIELPDLAPQPGDYYIIPNRDFFKNGEPNIVTTSAGTVPMLGPSFLVTVTFDAPWVGASPPPGNPPYKPGWGNVILLNWFGRYKISFKDTLGNYYETWKGTSFFVVTLNVIVHRL